ncbi:hydroxyethylthiazole kinase [Stomatohabitans albus]|uniref:hydroxyethylthiazole kinase n=1 Tax=Stomatohabitans albus TaxID=3110766 RepID=UPI00300D7869
MSLTSNDLGAVLQAVHDQEPLVQCITNVVVTNFTANSLLALGASAAMADLPDEAGRFAELASGLLINLGTPYKEQRAGMLEAVRHADQAQTPWVLDPVAVGALPVRTKLIEPLLSFSPTIIRGNASEIAFCAGIGSGGRGVDATTTVDAVAEAATTFAHEQDCVLAISGPIDVIIAPDGRLARIDNGSALLTKVTGGGCALGAVLAACAGVTDDPFIAAVTGTALWGVAADRAAARTTGPGSFAVALLDEVAALTPESLAEGVNLTT